MTSKNIYIIRHGQTDFNKKGIVQGSGIDASLNAEGERQVRKFYQCYKNVLFDKIYVSQLKRTQQSVAPFAQANIPVEIDPLLNEISWGIYEGKEISEDVTRQFDRIVGQWAQGNTSVAPEGGESPDLIAQRHQYFIQKIESRVDEKNILICMHGRVLRILLCQLTQEPLAMMDSFLHQNLCLYQVQYAQGRYTIVKRNDIKHLLD